MTLRISSPTAPVAPMIPTDGDFAIIFKLLCIRLNLLFFINDDDVDVNDVINDDDDDNLKHDTLILNSIILMITILILFIFISDLLL